MIKNYLKHLQDIPFTHKSNPPTIPIQSYCYLDNIFV